MCSTDVDHLGTGRAILQRDHDSGCDGIWISRRLLWLRFWGRNPQCRVEQFEFLRRALSLRTSAQRSHACTNFVTAFAAEIAEPAVASQRCRCNSAHELDLNEWVGLAGSEMTVWSRWLRMQSGDWEIFDTVAL